MPEKFILPMSEEDAASDARPLTDAEWGQVKPLVRSGTDWARVKREAAQDEPLPFDAESEPYNPSNPAEVADYWESATIKRGIDQAATPGPEADKIPAA